MKKFLIGIDQGTSSSRAILQSVDGDVEYLAQSEFQCIYPKIQWVEQNPDDILKTTISSCKKAIEKANELKGSIEAIGITNQRETTIIWDKKSGEPVYNAIVWQDRRTSDLCTNLINNGYEKEITSRTGLVVDPYFSATKIKWLLDNITNLRERAKKGELAFGTIDTFLLWHLTGGKVHATDATNASRTMLFNLAKQDWDDEILRELSIPRQILPEIKCSSDIYGVTNKNIIGCEIPITAILGDQQAAAVGQACFEPGILKCTYGTGCFAIMNIGEDPVYSHNRLLTTVAYKLKDKTTYALEGSVFVAGAAVQWLRDNLKVIKTAAETESLAKKLTDNEGVYIVPAFTGLGAPYWDSKARGIIVGLTRNTKIEHLARAVLEAACYQTYDLYDAMNKDCGIELFALRVDGGMTDNKWMLQYLADISNLTVAKSKVTQITAFGIAAFAGLAVGIYNDLKDIEKLLKIESEYKPSMDEYKRKQYIKNWRLAIKATRGYK
ncbi:MAG: glycerol kinase GlpK [Deferribacterota bacterium]|nr:glycerol kinase GlpK [Deferribacterota bacterium]